jgi:hypothetical protein
LSNAIVGSLFTLERRSRAPVGCDGGKVHCEQYARFGQFPDADHGPSGPMVAHLLDVSGVHRVEVAHLPEKDVDVDDVS